MKYIFLSYYLRENESRVETGDGVTLLFLYGLRKK